MKLMTQAQRERLIKNHKTNSALGGINDYIPVIKLFAGSSATWLLTEFNPDTLDFFGLCDLGYGCPELGYVDLASLKVVHAERDMYFSPTKTIGGYATEARSEQRILA
jgi:hypothetical protein